MADPVTVKTSVTDLTATAVIELARLGRVTDETYDALKAAIAPQPEDAEGDDQGDEGDDKSDKTGAKTTATTKGSASR